MSIKNPWLIAIIACIVMTVSNGMAVSGISVFDESILAEFGWNRGELKLGGMITFGVTALIAPFAGIILDRVGVKKCMLVGWLVLALAYFGYSNIQSLMHLYLVHASFGIVLVFCGLNPAIIIVSNWFKTKRGIAIGIALVGSSLGGVVFPQFGTAMVEMIGWRETFQWSILFPLFMFFLILLLVKDHPEPTADKVETSTEDSQTPANINDDSLSFSQALKTKTFWALAVIAMTTFYTVLGVQAHLFLYLRDLKITAGDATNAISAFFICAMIGKLAFGVVADYIHYRTVFTGNIIVMLIGSICLAMMSESLIWVAIILFGLGWGGVYTTLQLSVVNCFGLTSAGKILGTISILDCIGGGLGIWLTGVLYTQNGNYQTAFYIFATLVTIALLLVHQVKQPNETAKA